MSIKKIRIVKRSHNKNDPTNVEFVIQQRHFLFKWWWVDAWVNSSCGAACCDSFPTHEEAVANLWRFEKNTVKDVEVFSK